MDVDDGKRLAAILDLVENLTDEQAAKLILIVETIFTQYKRDKDE